MLIAIVIIGILSAVAVPYFLSQREKGDKLALTADVSTLNSKVGQEYAFHPDRAITKASFPSISLDKETSWEVNSTREAGWCIKVWNTKSKTNNTSGTAFIHASNPTACAAFGMTGTPWGGA
jgi:type II secretory pathway pseudopilin PulG